MFADSETTSVMSFAPRLTPSRLHLKLAMSEAAGAVARRWRMRTGGKCGNTARCQNAKDPVLLGLNSWVARLQAPLTEGLLHGPDSTG